MKARKSLPGQGVENPAYLGSRRLSLSLDALQETGVQPAVEHNEAVERLVERGPDVFMDPAEKESAWKVAVEDSVIDTVAQGLSVSKAERFRGMLNRRVNAFRRALRGNLPARVEPTRPAEAGGVSGQGQAV